MKVGAQVLIKGSNASGAATVEAATVCRTTKAMLPMPAGYVPVRFADGARLLAHESRMVLA
jgi:hypothetical protein